MPKVKSSKKNSIASSEDARNDMPLKGSKRALYIRRALEQRQESKRLSGICGDDYWTDA